LHDSLPHSGLQHSIFLNTDISQGSVATQLRCGGIVKEDFDANLLMNLSVKELWKSVNIWQSYGQDYSGLFFIEIFGSCPVTEFCHVQNSLCIQVLHSPILVALL